MNTSYPKKRVLLTDYAWPDTSIESQLIEAAGYELLVAQKGQLRNRPIHELAKTFEPAAILTCWANVCSLSIEASRNLRVVARMGVGLDNIDVERATQRGVLVTNVPDYCVDEVSDHAVGLVLGWTRGLARFDQATRNGEWNPASAKLRRLRSLTCGIVGFGKIGQATARKLSAFGPTILACTSSSSNGGPASAAADLQITGLQELLELSDVVILHVPLTRRTRGLIDRNRIAQMKQGSYLINVSRGQVVQTDALMEALQSGHLSGAGLDVLESEPEIPEALRNHAGVVITPHIAFSSETSLTELRQRACEEVIRILSGGRPLHPCKKPLLRSFDIDQ